MTACKHCGESVDVRTRDECWTGGSRGNGYGHGGLCCGCYDLSCGMPIDLLNKERVAQGKSPITKPWPK